MFVCHGHKRAVVFDCDVRDVSLLLKVSMCPANPRKLYSVCVTAYSSVLRTTNGLVTLLGHDSRAHWKSLVSSWKHSDLD